MPRPTDYARWRYIAMQCVMWLLLAGTLGIAALTSAFHSAASAASMALSEPIELESITVQVPARWKTTLDNTDELIAYEPTRRNRDSRGRSISIVESESETDSSRHPRVRSRRDQAIPMGPITGTFTASYRRVPVLGTNMEVARIELAATGLLPNGRTLTITLSAAIADDEDDLDPQDVALLKRVCDTIRLLDDRPQMKPAPNTIQK